MTSVAVPASQRRDLEVISVIGVGHFFAHFYILALPPLFPALTTGLGFSYTQLGLGLAVLNAATALSQVPVGIMVDRHGAFWPLLLGQIAFACGIGLVALAPSFPVFLALMVLAGLGNAVYHPADYSILAGSVSHNRLGRAFSVHTFGGYLGFAAAPALLLPLTAAFGWRTALVVAGLAGIVFAVLLVACRHLLHDEAGRLARKNAPPTLGLFTTWPVLAAFAFFTLISASGGGLSNFGTATLEQLASVDLAAAGLPVTVYLAASAIGVLLGGQIADRTTRHGLFVGGCFLVLAVLAAVLALSPVDMRLYLLLFAVLGLFSGAVGPSRDLMVKKITPAGASGRVFGFVTIGFNVGSILAAPVFGAILDHGMPRGVFWLVSLLSLVSILTLAGSQNAARATSHG